MSRFACSDEGVQEINGCASSIEEGVNTIKSETDTMRQVADEYTNTLGPHHSELVEALEAVGEAVKHCAEPAEGVVEKLEELADSYQDVIDTQRFKQLGN